MKSRNNLIFLVAGILIAGILCFKLAISNTIELTKEHKKLSKEVSFFNNISDQITLLNIKKKYHDSILSEMNLENTSLENNLLRTLNSEAKKNNLEVIDFNNPHIFMDKTGEIDTHIFTLQGNFKDMLSTIYILELKGKFGEVVHINFLKKKNYKSNKEYLIATIFIQNLK
tara:strand:+ start:26924 stop:27436 length:513 start_codon:yes stop_codon:yes gene_type:complete